MNTLDRLPGNSEEEDKISDATSRMLFLYTEPLCTKKFLFRSSQSTKKGKNTVSLARIHTCFNTCQASDKWCQTGSSDKARI